MEMEREADIFVGTEDVGPSSDSGSQPHVQFDRGSVTSSNLFLDLVGEVVLTLDSDGLSWQLVPDLEKVSFFSCFLLFHFCLDFPQISCSLNVLVVLIVLVALV